MSQRMSSSNVLLVQEPESVVQTYPVEFVCVKEMGQILVFTKLNQQIFVNLLSY